MKNKKEGGEDTPRPTPTKSMSCEQVPRRKKWNDIMLERRHHLNENYGD